MISRKRSKSKKPSAAKESAKSSRSRNSNRLEKPGPTEGGFATAAFLPDSAEDLEFADKLGRSVKISEIDFALWQKFHSDLDLQIPVWIKSEELLQKTLTKTIQFSRTVKSNPDDAPVRERDTFTFSIPSGATDGTRVVARKKGDREGEFCGDLIIILRVKC